MTAIFITCFDIEKLSTIFRTPLTFALYLLRGYWPRPSRAKKKNNNNNNNNDNDDDNDDSNNN